MFKYIDAYLVVSRDYDDMIEIHGAYVLHDDAIKVLASLDDNDDLADAYIEDITIKGELS